jgi:TRAP-type C4-dicarboxylate transport system substrate-binding protein
MSLRLGAGSSYDGAMPSLGWYIFLAAAIMLGVVLAVPGEGHSQEPRIVGTVGATVAPGDIGDVIWNNYAKKVSDTSNGRLAIKLLIRGETGGEDGMMTSLLRNRIQIASFSEAGMSRAVPEYGLLAAPYLFDSVEEWHFSLDNFLKPFLAELTAAKGLTIANWQDVGWNNIYGKKPLISPDDTKGYRMRALSSNTSVMFLESISADVIHLQRTELVTSLQTGLVEGGETALVLYARGGEANYAPHFTLTEHSRASGTSVFNKAWLEGLDAADRDIVVNGYGTEEEQRAEAARLYDAEMARLPGLGVTVHHLTPDQRRKFREATRANTAKLIEASGGRAQDLYDLVQKAKAEFAKRN